MAQAVGREWQQADEHLAMLARADRTVTMASAYQQCVRILTPAVRDRTPVGETGRLRASIKGEVRITPNRGLQGVVYTNVFYAHYVEMGTYRDFIGSYVRKRGRKWAQRNPNRRGVSARYMFRWAWERNRRRCEQIIGGAFGKLVGAWRGGRVGR